MDLHPFREYRQKYNLKQDELADILNLSYASISRIETGGQKVTIEIAERAERKLGIPRLELLYPNHKYKPKIYSLFFHKCKNLFSRRSNAPTKPEF